MELLLHMCCAPCSTYSVRFLREAGYQIKGYFYNPNIHPYKEFQKRLQVLEDFCQVEKIPLSACGNYDLELFLQNIMSSLQERCKECYRLRLFAAARHAASLGIPRFTTTLAISPYQNHDLLKQTGETAGREYGVEFTYFDLRSGYKESIEVSKSMGLYRQPYCGCIFSEKDRYYKAILPVK